MPERNTIDYIKTFFVYPELTKIHDRPTYESLKTLKNELKGNAASVRSNLGGGAHGHLGLVLTATEQVLVSPVLYIRPEDPGPLVLPAGNNVTNLQREIARDLHKENERVWIESMKVEKALLKQLVAALPPLYVRSFLNKASMSITQPLSAVLTTLFTTYGDVTDEELEETTTTLKARVFDISEPIVALFDEVEDLQELSIAAENELTERQLVQIGVQLIKNTNNFERGLETWLSQPIATRTWINFKLISVKHKRTYANSEALP